MDKWPHKVSELGANEILDAVHDDKWQTFRRSLKGLNTGEKLDKLEKEWRQEHAVWDGQKWVISRRIAVQIDNYINALKRGGLLNDNLEVVR